MNIILDCFETLMKKTHVTIFHDPLASYAGKFERRYQTPLFAGPTGSQIYRQYSSRPM